MHELPPLPGHSATAATAINDDGMAVGISGDCDVAVGRWSARAAVVWEHGVPMDIGHLGGEGWHTPMALNERGEVVGFSNPAGVVGGALRPRAFLWSARDGVRDLGTLPGDTTSQAFGINAHRQVVGRSCAGGLGVGCRAVVWERGVPTDLNALVDLDEGDVLTAARFINDAGRIVGNMFDAGTGATIPFVAIPHAAP
jgi:uncharacterized membrane protein